MALDIKVTATLPATDALSITLKDVTGAYNASTNVGGYGAPNPIPTPYTDAVVLRRHWTETTYTQVPLSTADITAILGTGYVLANSNKAAFQDGVQHFKYLPGLTVAGVTGTVASTGDYKIALSGALTYNTDYKWVGLVIGGKTVVYEIDWASSSYNNGASSYLMVKTPLTAVAGSAVKLFAEGDLKVKVDKAAQACLVSSIGTLATFDGNCDRAERVQNKLLRYFFAADVQFDLKDYEGANNLITTIVKHCANGDCNC